VLFLLLSICPVCGVLGYLTPGLVDQYSRGSPQRAGTAYAINVLGCILGPLFASYILLPWISNRYALILLGLPFLAFLLSTGKALGPAQRLGFGALACAVLAGSIIFSRSFEDYAQQYGKNAVLRRDYAASVISFGDEQTKHLLINGMGMTVLTPVTKFMSHLPLAFHHGRPESALIICFGMGTSFRSALSWDVRTTTVELVPSVTKAFGFYHADADQVCRNGKGEMVIDDGRRFLERTRGSYDVIVVDPPPPIAAAGSSLLYSKEFYEAAKRRLNPGGILQAWIPGTASKVGCAALRSICEEFPYVRSFPSVQKYGIHMLASMQPIEKLSAPDLVARLPLAAQRDLLEWSSTNSVSAYLNEVIANEIPLETFLKLDSTVKITDDQPYNEYFLLRRMGLP
jgi:predicted membrane-bound spermidine synthase